MLALLAYLQSIHPIAPEAQAMLGTMLKEYTIPKGKHWLKEGAVCERIAFIQTGLVRVYFESGSKEVCLWYNKEDEVMISVHSFFSQAASSFAIQAVVDTRVFYITYAQLQQVFDRHLGFNVNARRILEHYYSLSEMHVRLLLLPIDERLRMLGQLYPWMLSDERITAKMLAAYIGVSPEHLSRYRSRK